MKFRVQAQGSFNCGPIAVQNLFLAFNLKPPTLKRLEKLLECRRGKGTNSFRMQQVLKYFDFKIKKVKRRTKQSSTYIILIPKPKNKWHYIVSTKAGIHNDWIKGRYARTSCGKRSFKTDWMYEVKGFR